MEWHGVFLAVGGVNGGLAVLGDRLLRDRDFAVPPFRKRRAVDEVVA